MRTEAEEAFWKEGGNSGIMKQMSQSDYYKVSSNFQSGSPVSTTRYDAGNKQAIES